MTTTHIYQGVNDDAKPSSRVIAPPGGGSSFSLGHEDNPAPQQRKQQVDHAPKQPSVTVEPANDKQPAQKPRQQRIGDDSFDTLFGVNSPGDPYNKSKKTKRKVNSDVNESYYNVFGGPCEAPKPRNAHVKLDNSFDHVYGPPRNIHVVDSSRSCVDSENSPSKGDGGHNTSFSRVFGDYERSPKAVGTRRIQAQASVNPITGEPLYPTTTKPQEQASATKLEDEEDDSTASQSESVGAPAGRPSTNVVNSTRVIQPPGGRSTKLW